MNETPICVVGRVVTDPKAVRISDDAMKLTFRVAANERRFDRSTEQWVDGDSLYLTVNCWRRVASGAASSLVKGDPVIVTGRLRTRQWENPEGQQRSMIELEANAVGPDLTHCTAVVRRPRRDGQPPSAAGADERSADSDAQPSAGHEADRLPDADRQLADSPV